MQIDLYFLGIYPRQVFGLIGIIFAPVIHGNYIHLISNALPLLILGTVLFYFYDRIAIPVFLLCYFPTGILVWIFGKPNYHIGASGLIYGIAFFLMTFGFFRKDFGSLLISAIVVFFYGGIIYGVFPTQPGVSWESHFFGALMGLVSASYFSKFKKVSSYY
jgi:membrane associated rhomboid family serine protease